MILKNVLQNVAVVKNNINSINDKIPLLKGIINKNITLSMAESRFFCSLLRVFLYLCCIKEIIEYEEKYFFIIVFN